MIAQRRTLPRATLIATLALAGIAAHLALRWGAGADAANANLPLYLVLAGGGTPLVLGLATKALRREFGSDLLAGISIVTAVILREYLAGAIVVGEAPPRRGAPGGTGAARRVRNAGTSR